jgi:hypothetical protein
MGRISLLIFQKIIFALFFLVLGSRVVQALEYERLEIPATLECEGKKLPLSGVGLRTATFLKIKVFVLAIYAPERIKNGRGSELHQRPLCFEVTYLRDFDNKEVNNAWDFQFKESAQHSYPSLKGDIEKLKEYFGEIKGSRKQSFILSVETTKMHENGQYKGEIKGLDFQKSFLSIWFGSNPPTKELQRSILKEI